MASPFGTNLETLSIGNYDCDWKANDLHVFKNFINSFTSLKVFRAKIYPDAVMYLDDFVRHQDLVIYDADVHSAWLHLPDRRITKTSKIEVIGARHDRFNKPIRNGDWTPDYLQGVRNLARKALSYPCLKTWKIYIDPVTNPDRPRFEHFVAGDNIYELIANNVYGILQGTAWEMEHTVCKIDTISFIVQQRYRDGPVERNDCCETHTFTF
jgi:hypothetical protein